MIVMTTSHTQLPPLHTHHFITATRYSTGSQLGPVLASDRYTLCPQHKYQNSTIGSTELINSGIPLFQTRIISLPHPHSRVPITVAQPNTTESGAGNDIVGQPLCTPLGGGLGILSALLAILLVGVVLGWVWSCRRRRVKSGILER